MITEDGVFKEQHGVFKEQRRELICEEHRRRVSARRTEDEEAVCEEIEEAVFEKNRRGCLRGKKQIDFMGSVWVEAGILF